MSTASRDYCSYDLLDEVTGRLEDWYLSVDIPLCCNQTISYVSFFPSCLTVVCAHQDTLATDVSYKTIVNLIHASTQLLVEMLQTQHLELVLLVIVMRATKGPDVRLRTCVPSCHVQWVYLVLIHWEHSLVISVKVSQIYSRGHVDHTIIPR